MSFSADDYYPPQWSAPPSHNYYFQVIKEGNLLGKLQIKKKEFNLIGRLNDLCDIFIDNPLVSRKHAILQAKANDHYLYLMDLESQHGTFVNKVQLPPHTYKKLEPFQSVKFGVSSRYYVLRCPQHQAIMQNQNDQKENQFAKLLEEQHRQLSKEQMKAKYLDMLQNDPYFAANQAPRKLMGKQQQIVEEDEYAGIDWGISDQRQIYAYRNDSQFPIEPDLLRRLNLDSNQLGKLGQYENHLRNYQEMESELNQITAKEKREFGLEEKLRNKKEKFQKKFVEALEQLEKSQDWLRANIFGQISDRNKKNIVNIRQKENDTFGDDIFLDRTLQKKEEQKIKKEQVADIDVYWTLESKLKSQTISLEQMQQKLNTLLTEKGKPPTSQIQMQQQIKEEDDQLDAYMKQTQLEADDSNILILQREIKNFQESIEETKNKLKNIVGSQQLNKILATFQTKQSKTLQQQFAQKSQAQNKKMAEIKKQQNKNIEDILNKLENIQQEEEQVDQYSMEVFKKYKPTIEQKEQIEQLNEEEQLNQLRAKRQHYDPSKFSKPMQKVRKGNDHDPIPPSDPKPQTYEEEDEVDLTKHFQ